MTGVQTCALPISEEQVFLAALDLVNPADRAVYLEKACGGDVEFRRQVEDLLAAHFRTGEFLDEPVGKQMRRTARNKSSAENSYTIHT